MYGGLKRQGSGLRVADWRSGLQDSQGLKPGDRVRPSVLGIWIGMGDEDWHESRPQVSGRERYSQTHFVTIRQRKRGTADE